MYMWMSGSYIEESWIIDKLFVIYIETFTITIKSYNIFIK